jgi:Holliday junction resolvasome RuvABC endonuclease subunit
VVFLGIDPGKGGGIAAVDESGKVLGVEKMPGTEAELLASLRQWPDGVTRAVLEKVHAGVFGGGRMGSVSAFTFGQGYGTLRTALVASSIPFDEVMPLKWQQAMQCRSKGDKNVTKRRATELFPGVKCTHYNSDALLIAEYARRLEVRS